MNASFSPESASLSGAVPFSRLTPADRPRYERFLSRQPVEISDLQFVSRIAWRDGFHYHWAVIEDALVIVAQVNTFTGLHFSAPLGLSSCGQLERILSRIWNPYAELSRVLTGADQPYLRILFVPECQLPCYESLSQYNVQIRHDPNYSDYVYQAEKLRTLSGKSLHAKRNHWNRFCKEHPNAVYAPMQQSDHEDALALTESWCTSREYDPEDIRSSDYPAIASLFQDWEQLSVCGGTIREDGKLRAFSIYSHRGEEMAYCHFEKAARGHEDFYIAIQTLTLRHAFPQVLWVNREEDMGIPGLRQAKLSFKPDHMVQKYEVILTRKSH